MVNFDLKDLRVFTAVALVGSIARASELVHLSPSAVSDRLSELEQRFAMRLFVRGPRGMRLNEAGKAFAVHAQRLLDEAAALDVVLARFRHASKRSLRVCANYNASVTFLPGKIGRFLAKHADVQVDLMQCSSPEIVKFVAAHEADIGITAFSGVHPLLEFHPFASDSLVAVVPSTNPLAQRGGIAFSELFPYDYIGLGAESAMQTFLYRCAEEEGKIIRPRILASNHEAVLSLVAAGAGVSVLPNEIVRKRENVVKLRLVEPWAARRLRLCVRKDRSTYSDRVLIEAFLAEML